jgi:hypothetical protein
MRLFTFFALTLGCLASCAPKQSNLLQECSIPYDTHPNQTLRYEELVEWYQKMAMQYPKQFRLETAGATDAGAPLHVAVVSKGGHFDPAAIRAAGKCILLINNGIHPGEPEGIDATCLLIRELLTNPAKAPLLDHLVVVVIPVYNVGGCINRGSNSRANQNGPEEYGFRGNARNYDLNRDFIKSDTKNAQSFHSLFQRWNPDVFIDNHTSNGADYPYTMTLISTLPDKLESPLGAFLEHEMLPYLYDAMKEKQWEMIPYVDTYEGTPESGLVAFCDYGRYSTGYAALWNTIGFMPETHMLKPFSDRLQSTKAFMETTLEFVSTHQQAILKHREQAIKTTQTKSEFHLDYSLDKEHASELTFKGYTARFKPSEVSGHPRLWYDRNAAYEKIVPYYNRYIPSLTLQKPVAYLIPQAWEPVVERLQRNGVAMVRLEENLDLEVESYRIGEFKNREAWEGHYFHHRIQVEKNTEIRAFRKGDWVVWMDQTANRFLMETLEPQAPDSWMAWNFFDPILMQKEYFSDYVFEDLAADYLKKNPEIRAQLDEKKAKEPEFNANGRAQLDWVYRHSPWYEPSHRLYPVARVVAASAVQKLPRTN